LIVSILDSIKKNLGLDTDYTIFDPDITMHINSVFFSLQQLGVGPADGFAIEDNTANWDLYIGTDQINAVKSYVYIKVRLMFDPPATSFAIDSLAKQAEELEWRLNVQQEMVRHPLGADGRTL
jgi:hypothetical protein